MSRLSINQETQDNDSELSQLGDEFSRLLKQNRQAIFSHIVVLTGNISVAEDIFQDTCIILFEKFPQFKPDAGFQAWAKQVALNVVLNYRRKKKNHFTLFSEGYFEHLASVSSEREKEQDRRSDALAKPGDGKVDGSDVTILAGNWQHGVSDTADATWEMGDFNGDGIVDGSDVTVLAGNWQYGVVPAAIAVPEPGMMVLLLGVATIHFFRRRTRSLIDQR